MPMTFQFRWIPFIAMTLVVAIGISLGQWQMRRAGVKQEIETRLAVRQNQAPVMLGATAQPLPIEDMEYRQARVRGEFVRRWPVYLDNRPHQGVPGFYVLMPFEIAGSGTHVLVARGWVPRNVAERSRLPILPTPAGVVEIEGTIRRAPGRLLQLGEPQPLRPHGIVQNLDISDFEQAAQMPMLPFLLEQTSDVDDGLVRDWPRPSSGVDKHKGYAFQWYALAGTAFIFFIVTGFRRG